MKIMFLAILMALAGSFTENPGPKSVGLVVWVIDEEGRPVSEADVHIDESPAGTTDDRGRLEARLLGPEGRLVRVRAHCPQGMTIENGDVKSLSVRFFKRIDTRDATLAPMEAGFRCISKTKRLLLLVRTDSRADLPVRALGRQGAQTDSDGVAQAVLEGTAGDEIEITIDTSLNPALRPAMPTRRLTIPRMSQILVFDQQFTQRKVKKKRRRRRPRNTGPRRP